MSEAKKKTNYVPVVRLQEQKKNNFFENRPWKKSIDQGEVLWNQNIIKTGNIFCSAWRNAVHTSDRFFDSTIINIQHQSAP